MSLRRRLTHITDFLDELTPECKQIVMALREIIATVIPAAEESVLWSGLSYHRPWIGGRVKGAVCQISVKRGVVQLDFIHGRRLSDPGQLLQGTRLSKRFVPVQSPTEARSPGIAELIRKAAELDPNQWTE